MKSTTFIIQLLLWCFVSFIVAQQQCTFDYQCNSIPYGICAGSADDCTTTLPGVAVDTTTNFIYYFSSCRPFASDTSYFPFQNATLKRIPINGGVATDIFTTFIYPAPGNIGRIFAAEGGVVYYDRTVRAAGSPLIGYYLQSKLNTYYFPTPGSFQSKLDISGGNSFTCQLEYSNPSTFYSIVRYEGAIKGDNSYPSGTRLYSLGLFLPCGPVRRGVGTDLVFTAISYTTDAQFNPLYVTSFYRGSVNGGNSLPSVLFNATGFVNDFDVATNGAIVYGTDKGLFKRVGATTTILNNERITGISVVGDRVYYNNGASIRSTNLGGQGTNNLVQPATTGKCTCRAGFSGEGCRTCNNGQVQYDYNNNPRCVPVNAAGVPSSCYQDYQCGNVPYTVCYGYCTCRTNFTGDRCDQCAPPRATYFVDGIPRCG